MPRNRVLSAQRACMSLADTILSVCVPWSYLSSHIFSCRLNCRGARSVRAEQLIDGHYFLRHHQLPKL
jgi:hypothetical protein